MSVQIVTCLLGREINRSPFAVGAKPLRVVTEISGGDSVADIAPVIIKPK